MVPSWVGGSQVVGADLSPGFVAVAWGDGHSLGLEAYYGYLNCDGVVNFADINPFVLALFDPGGYAPQYPRCHLLNGDCNGDGVVNSDDVNSFVALLTLDRP